MTCASASRTRKPSITCASRPARRREEAPRRWCTPRRPTTGTPPRRRPPTRVRVAPSGGWRPRRPHGFGVGRHVGEPHEQARVGRSERQHVDAHPVAGVLDRHLLAQVGEPELRRAVRRELRRHDRAEGRPHGHDRSAARGHHVRHGVTHAQERALQVDVDDPLPVVVGAIDDRRARFDRRAQHERGQRAARGRQPDDSSDLGIVADVALFDPRLGRVDVQPDDVVAIGPQPIGDRRAQARRRTSDQRDAHRSAAKPPSAGITAPDT